MVKSLNSVLGTKFSPSIEDSVLGLMIQQYARDLNYKSELVSFFSKYGLLVGDNNLVEKSVRVMESNTGDLEKRITIECVSHPKIDNEILGSEDSYNFLTSYLCSASISKDNSLFLATSYSFSDELDDTDLYEDLRSMMHAFHPELRVDIFRDDHIDTLDEGDPPMTIYINEIYNGRTGEENNLE